MKILAIPVPRENVKNVRIRPLHQRNLDSGPRSTAILPTLNPIRKISQLHLLVRADSRRRLLNRSKLRSRIIHSNYVKNKPDRVKGLERRLRPVVKHYGDKKAQSKPAKFKISQQLEAYFPERGDDPRDQ